MPNGGIGMSFVTKQGWVIMVLSPQIAAGSVLQMGAAAPGATETGKAMATYANEGKTWVSQSGTLTFEKLGSLTAGGTVARFTDVVFKANVTRRHRIPKQQCQVAAWAEYDASPRQRGNLIVRLSDKAITSWQAESHARRGGQPRYSALAITIGHTPRAPDSCR